MKTLTLIVVLLAAVIGTGCEVVQGLANECPAGLVAQADLCPGTAGRLALCKARGEEDGVSAPLGVAWCLVATTPAEGVTDYVECVQVCP